MIRKSELYLQTSILYKLFFDELCERFCFKSSSGNSGILGVLQNFQNTELEQKIRTNRKRGVFRDAYPRSQGR